MKNWNLPGKKPFWFVCVNGNEPSLQTVSYTKRGAIKYWVETAGKTWRYWHRNGYRAKQVDIAWRHRRV